MRNKTLRIGFFFLVAVGWAFLGIYRSSGFSFSKIFLASSKQGYNINLDDFDVKFSEPYTYLSHGRQSFVFESADHKTVLKIFNQRYFQSKWYHFFFVMPKWKEKLQEKLSLRRNFYEQSYPLASQAFPLESGILYIHLHPSSSLPKISLIDSMGRLEILDLNQVAFVIQKKAKPYLVHMQEVSALEGFEGLKREIDAWLCLCKKRIDRGICDYDHDIWNNVGISEKNIIFIDPGKFYQSKLPLDSKAFELEWWKATHRLYKWLLTNNPKAARYLRDNTLIVCSL